MRGRKKKVGGQPSLYPPQVVSGNHVTEEWRLDIMIYRSPIKVVSNLCRIVYYIYVRCVELIPEQIGRRGPLTQSHIER
jgi:hypothetical protein